MNFRVGDIVKCINIVKNETKTIPLSLDKEYVIVGVDHDRLEVIDDNGKQGSYFRYRFIPKGMDFCTFDLDEECL